MSKKHLFWFLLFPMALSAQPTMKLQEAYDLAQAHYPVSKQKELINQTSSLTLENIAKGFLPQFSLSAQASYQSDVTRLPIQLPGLQVTPPAKDQYKIVADASQLIYDGGVLKDQKNLQQLKALTEQEQVDVQLYQLKERINQVFLGALLLDAQLQQVSLIKADLLRGISRTEAQVVNGVAFRSNLNLLKAEVLKTEQREIEITASKKGLLQVLSLLIGKPLQSNTVLIPPGETILLDSIISRPELKLFESQQKLLDGQLHLISSKNMPKASLFAQGGYGRPGLNMLQNDFDLFYITGLRLNWNFGGLYTRKNEKRLVQLSQQMIVVQQETFLLNSNTALTQQMAEVQKLQSLISKDTAIISLRTEVKLAAEAQLANGVATVNDYLREVTAEDQARQQLILHSIQLVQAQINYSTISGKQ